MTDATRAPIGIFDSGLGGVSCLGQGVHMLPAERFIYFGDSGERPYSLMSKAAVKDLCFKICDDLVDRGAKAVVVACNTATSVAIAGLREKYDLPVLGMEPAVKVAANCGLDGDIIIMATGMVLKSRTLDNLIQRHCRENAVVRLACRDVITLVESGVMEGPEMEACLKRYFAPFKSQSVASVVFGCTHFGFLQDLVKKVLGSQVHIADGNEGTIRHLKNTLAKADMLNDGSGPDAGGVEIYNSGGSVFIENSKKMLWRHVANLESRKK